MPALHRSILAATMLAAAIPAYAIVGGTNTSAFGNVAGGVQITDNWVLTAKHLGYVPGITFADGYGSATVAAVYNIGSGAFPADDLTLLRLETSIAAPSLQLEADVLPVGVQSPAVAATITTGLNQVPRGYAFTDVREVWDSEAGIPVSWLVAYSPTLGAPYVEGGDSGGGLFLGHVTDSSGSVLMGITSAIWSNGLGGHASAFIQLASYQTWINTTMANDSADTQLPTWVSAVPEPSTSALFIAGCVLLAGISTRRVRGGLPAVA